MPRRKYQAPWGASPASSGLFDSSAFGLSAADGEEMLRERTDKQKQRRREREGEKHVIWKKRRLRPDCENRSIKLGKQEEVT